ncbi:MAG: type II toxin-antitoxin system Phd/YefM family antitoxin [Nitrospirae bacterium]|nr:type II toxin-antitoxin system Phd/YefM family antitoxin [Nitrospirota bacterium]
MKQVDQFVSVTDAKNRLLDLIRSLAEKDEVLAITRGGIPAAVVLSPERYEGLLETIEVLSDPRSMESIRRSLKQARKGRWLSEEEVFGKEKARLSGRQA